MRVKAAPFLSVSDRTCCEGEKLLMLENGSVVVEKQIDQPSSTRDLGLKRI